MPFSHSKSTQTKNKLLVKGVSVDSQHSVKFGYKFTEKFGPPARIPRGGGSGSVGGGAKKILGGVQFSSSRGYTPLCPCMIVVDCECALLGHALLAEKYFIDFKISERGIFQAKAFAY